MTDPPADPPAWNHADIIRLLGDHDAPAPQRPTEPPEPTRTRAEQGDLLVGQLNALGYAAQSEHIRLSALYCLGCAYGYEYVGDRILDLAQHARSEHVQLSALRVAAHGLGLLKPLRSLVPDADPDDFELRVVRLFASSMEEINDLNRCLLPDPPGPPSPLDLERYLYNLQYAYSPHTEQVPDIEELTAELAAEYAAKHGEAQAAREALERAARYAADPDGNFPPNPYHPAYAQARAAADADINTDASAQTGADISADAQAGTAAARAQTQAAAQHPPSPRNPLPRLPTPRLPRPIRIAKVDTSIPPARPIPAPPPAPTPRKTANTKPVSPIRQKVLEAYEQARQAHRRRQNQPPTAGGDNLKSPPILGGDVEGGASPRPPP